MYPLIRHIEEDKPVQMIDFDWKCLMTVEQHGQQYYLINPEEHWMVPTLLKIVIGFQQRPLNGKTSILICFRT